MSYTDKFNPENDEREQGFCPIHGLVFPKKTYDKFYGTSWECPICGEDIVPYINCGQCGEPKEDNGETYCDNCKERSLRETILSNCDLKTRWDDELIDLANTKILEG